MTDNPSGTVTGEPGAEPTANSNFAVLAAIAGLGDKATPAAIATKVGIAYSTVNPKLRAWETAGLAERFKHDTGQTLWRLTDAGRASTATPPQFAATAAPTEPAAADTVTEQPAGTTSPPSAGAQPSTAAATEPRHDGASQEPATTLPPVAAASDAPDPEPTTANRPLGGDVSSDEEPADTAVSSTSPTVTASEPATPAADEAAAPDEDHDAGTETTAVAPAKRRRPKGALQTSALAILQANPDREYTVDEVKKEIDQADAATGYPPASHGAVSNALDKLGADAAIERVDDRKAVTFRLTPAAD